MKTKAIDTKPSQSRSYRLTLQDYLVFIIPLLGFIQLNIVGVLNGTDISLLFAFFYLLIRGKIRIKSPLAKKFLLLGLLWLVSQCVTDVVRHSPFSDYARGWSNIGLTLVNFVTLYTLLYGRPKRFVLYGCGLVPSAVLAYFIHTPADERDYVWKFGYASSVSLAAALLATRKEFRGNKAVALLVMAGLINVLLGARSAGGICLVAALYLFVTRELRIRAKQGRVLSATAKSAIGASLALGILGIFWAYQYAAGNGILGDEARDKFEDQASGKYGLLLGGRTELFSSIPAVIDSPILGHGSWAKDPAYIIEGRQAMMLLGYKGAVELDPDELREGLIPTHSFLLGAWVYAGILGAVFWGWVWVMIVKSLARIYPAAADLLPLMSYFGFLLLWDILFSPFGLDRRNEVPYYLLLILMYYETATRNAAKAPVKRAGRSLKAALAPGH